ncbi:hypothetical protein ACH6CV_00415 [Bacillota bacterium Meth-B3]|nr:hypothetical protein [Christensenellaceae bacterium]MEA5069054.1 hypothetical protein [Christensenellaceae bacterium]
MIIRHGAEELYGQSVQNTFVAYDDLEEELGQAVVIESHLAVLCAGRPHHLMIRTQCESEARDALIGAATARALQLARMEPGLAARVYTECEPDDENRMRALEALGYRDDDGLVRMRKHLSRGPIVKPLPAGCTIVRDYLIDEDESRFFIERYNLTFARTRDLNWLKSLKALPNFARLLVVANTGLAGELLTWSDGDAGVVGIICVAPAWQRKGAASYLLELSRLYWLDKGLREAYFDVWTRLTGAVRLAATSGFRPEKMLMRYPGIDVY